MVNQASSGGVTTSDGVVLVDDDDQFVQKDSGKTDQIATVAELPEDLITEILLCSSVKSLLRFRCVSKSFRTTIDSDLFIRLHHNRSVENKKNRKLIVRESSMFVHSFDVDSGIEEKIKEPSKKTLKPYGYCNGLILLFVGSSKLAVWNPSIQQYRYLPPCPISVPNGARRMKTGMGLGYDSTRDDYKVVLIEEVKINYNTRELQVWVFGLRSKSWRRIQDFPCRKDKFIYSGHFANGYVHWLCKPPGGEYALVTLDVANETIVSQPLHPAFRYWCQTDLHVLDGSLCISYFSENPKAVNFYVREKDGTQLKWSMLFSVTPEVPILFGITRFKNVRVLGYSTEGDKVMLDLGFKFLVSYDLKEKIFATSKLRKLVDDDQRKHYNYPFLCVESLASVDGGDVPQQSGHKRKNRA